MAMERFARNELLGDLPFEFDAIKAVLGHGFHPLKARQLRSIPKPAICPPPGAHSTNERLNCTNWASSQLRQAFQTLKLFVRDSWPYSPQTLQDSPSSTPSLGNQAGLD